MNCRKYLNSSFKLLHSWGFALREGVFAENKKGICRKKKAKKASYKKFKKSSSYGAVQQAGQAAASLFSKAPRMARGLAAKCSRGSGIEKIPCQFLSIKFTYKKERWIIMPDGEI